MNERRDHIMINKLKSQPLDDKPLLFDGLCFQPVMDLPDNLVVFDFSQDYDPNRTLDSPYGIGKYDECRPTMYTEPQFAETARNIHMGVDLAAPVGTPVYAFYSGRVYAKGVNPLPQDYGPTIITEHQLNGITLYALYGHLSCVSLSVLSIGEQFESGTMLGWVGDFEENGGWNPHLHFQLSRLAPATHDLPGVVSARQHAAALVVFPDPRLVLGNLYVD